MTFSEYIDRAQDELSIIAAAAESDPDPEKALRAVLEAVHAIQEANEQASRFYRQIVAERETRGKVICLQRRRA